MDQNPTPARSNDNLRVLFFLVLGLPLLPSSCLATVGARYWLLSRQDATELTPAVAANPEELPRFVTVHGQARSAPMLTTTDDNLLFLVEGHPSVVFVYRGARDRDTTQPLCPEGRCDGRLYTADDWSSLAVNQFANRVGIQEARVVRVGETPESQLWHVKLSFGIAGAIMALALGLAGWIWVNRSRFTAPG